MTAAESIADQVAAAFPTVFGVDVDEISDLGLSADEPFYFITSTGGLEANITWSGVDEQIDVVFRSIG